MAVTLIPDLEDQLKQAKRELESVEMKEDELAIEELSEFGSSSRRQRANTNGSSASHPGPISGPPLRASAPDTPWPSMRLRDSSSSSSPTTSTATPATSINRPIRSSTGSAGYPYPPDLSLGLAPHYPHVQLVQKTRRCALCVRSAGPRQPKKSVLSCQIPSYIHYMV
jgi:hypothetical protein